MLVLCSVVWIANIQELFDFREVYFTLKITILLNFILIVDLIQFPLEIFMLSYKFFFGFLNKFVEPDFV